MYYALLITGLAYVAVTLIVCIKPINSVDSVIASLIAGINRPRPLDYAAVVLTKYGRFYTWGLVDLGLLVLRLWIPFAELTLSIMLAYIIGGVTRLLVKRRRPYEAGYGKPILAASGFSYPSGHAAVVFSGALVALMTLNKTVSLILLAEAILVTASRVYLNAHYLTDVIGGVLLGLTSGFLAIALTPILIVS
ncbi:phosphatase PAP2 family protein [Caldivirga maquilingensis]|uniref:Phosphoesterase PA-phosphatase related n=1 Tax=Caldivirga maquilingensis (strain ATCC 700844 / DSM 13496 / JCM 10307 / IC-167) TaxID=397948 RepID=A8M8P3_CALMQ|nr:phosphatase PAP2 family protein [Caldivirga maquilingensis]ABW02112.1 phosphoesterase PA-phosphatase related [Caldivirga maquilingensis IC-167]